MHDDLVKLWPRLPHLRSFHPFDDISGLALMAGRWYEPEFETLTNFIEFCYFYATAMQAILEDLPRSEIEAYYTPIPETEETAKAIAEDCVPQQIDAYHRLRQSINFLSVPWLSEGDHPTTAIVQWDDNPFPDIFGYGKEGYVLLYVRELVGH